MKAIQIEAYGNPTEVVKVVAANAAQKPPPKRRIPRPARPPSPVRGNIDVTINLV
jgi:hypothetical protein